MNELRERNYASAFALLIGLMGVFMIVGGLLAIGVGELVIKTGTVDFSAALRKPENVWVNRLLNTSVAFIAFFLPAYIVARRYNTAAPFAELGFNKKVSINQIGLIVVIVAGSLFLSGALANINEQIPMSSSFLQQARAWENSYRDSILSIATMKNFSDYLITLVVIAIIPGIIEEVFFRGALQPILIGWFKNVHLGIIVGAVIFSAIHGSYFGFLPRVGLGIVLGIVFYQSKNLWLSVWLHMLNNAIAVTQIYWLTNRGMPVEKAIDEVTPLWMGFIALVLIPAFYFFQRESNRILAKTIDNRQ